MNIKTKQGGEWIHLSTLSDRLGVLDITIPEGRALGDVDGDGKIDGIDAFETMQASLYEETNGESGKDFDSQDPLARTAANVYQPELNLITQEDAEAISYYSILKKGAYIGRDISGKSNWRWVPEYYPSTTNSMGDQVEGGRYVYTISLLGITKEFSIIALLDYNVDRVFAEFKCKENLIEIVAFSIPTSPVHASLIYTASGSVSSIFLMGGMTKSQRQSIINSIQNELPVEVESDGYTKIKNQRLVTGITNKKVSESKIEIHYTLQGTPPKEVVDVINLDSRDRPISGTSNGREFKIRWEGF